MRKIFFLTVAALLGLLFLVPVWADEIEELRKEMQMLRQDYETRIEKLEVQINMLSKDQGEKITQLDQKVDKKFLDIEYVGRYEGPFKKGGLLINNPSGFGNVTVGGYADIEYRNFQKQDSTFDQYRWIINIGAELLERLRFYSEYEIEHGGPNSAGGGGEAKIEQAWIDYLIADWINARAGALLVPFGRYNLYHDSDLQDLTARPLVARRVIPTTWTEAGAGFQGELNPILWSYEDLMISYEGYVINGLNAGFSDSGMRGARGSLSSDNNQFKSLVGRTVISPFQNHELGLSGYYGEYDTLGHYIKGAAIDWFNSFKVPLKVSGISFGPLELVGEAAYFDIDAPSNRVVPKYMTGLYAQANLHFWPDFLTDTFLGRNFKNSTFTLSTRYDWIKIADDGDATIGANEEQRFTIGLNYRPVESWVFKTEYQVNTTNNEPLEQGGNDGFIASIAMGF